MAASEQVQRVRIYLRERDRWEGEPLYSAVLNQLQQAGATGATALRGLAGFGPGYLVRTAANGPTTNDAPVVIEWVDRTERIGRLLPLLDALLPNALTTVEDIQVYRAALRSRGPFSDAFTAGDIATNDVVTVGPDDSIGAAVYTLLGRDQELLPVLDEDQHLVGAITSGDLQRRGGLLLPFRVLRVLSPDERRPFLQPLVQVTARSCMTSEPRYVNALSNLTQALVGMLEWNYAALPVTDRDGHFKGLLTRALVLRAASQQPASDESAVRDAEPPTAVQLVMQIAVPQASTTDPLATVLAQLLATPQRFLVLTDAAGRVRGTLTDADVLQRLRGDERAQFLAALSGEDVTLPGSDQSIEPFAQPALHTINPRASIEEAIERFVRLGIERAPVVDEDSKLVGLLTTTTLLRALSQAS